MVLVFDSDLVAMDLFFGLGDDFLTLAADLVLAAPGPGVAVVFDTAFLDTAFFDRDFLTVFGAAGLSTVLRALFDDVLLVALPFFAAALVEEADFFTAALLAPCDFFLGATVC